MAHQNWTRVLSTFSSLTAAVFGVLLFTGCASDSPQAPQERLIYKGDNVPFAVTPSVGARSASLGSEPGDWYPAASGVIGAAGGTISGGRWTLIVPEGAWDTSQFGESVSFSIDEQNPGLLAVQFSPHGIVFEQAVTLVVNYSGTNVDPDSPNYDETVPFFFYHNPATDVWDPLQGTNDKSTKVLTVQLHHFSVYALFGTPGWYGTRGTPGW